ncbi:hypothetical protein I3760_02G046500 [Carya illinoinensis]|nr:hypothetical protein I3760_02G046500 [Carya illinoinensis]
MVRPSVLTVAAHLTAHRVTGSVVHTGMSGVSLLTSWLTSRHCWYVFSIFLFPLRRINSSPVPPFCYFRLLIFPVLTSQFTQLLRLSFSSRINFIFGVLYFLVELVLNRLEISSAGC